MERPERQRDVLQNQKDSPELFRLSVDDTGRLSISIRKDFWEHDDEDVMMAVVLMATFALSENDSVLQAKNMFAKICNTMVAEGALDVMPAELAELKTQEQVEFDMYEDIIIFPAPKGVM
jgi:hypothetical protein